MNNYSYGNNHLNSGSERYTKNASEATSNIYQSTLDSQTDTNMNSQVQIHPSRYTQQNAHFYQTVVPNSVYGRGHVEVNIPTHAPFHNRAPMSMMDHHIMMQMYRHNQAIQSRIQSDQHQIQTYFLNQGQHLNHTGHPGHLHDNIPLDETNNDPTRNDLQNVIPKSTAINHLPSHEEHRAEQNRYHVSEENQTHQTSCLPCSEDFNLDSNLSPKNEKSELIRNYYISITSLSTSPMSGEEIINLVKSRTTEVITTYMPCVDFLVICQQELRQALALAQEKSGGRSMATSKFYNQFFRPLPARFFTRSHLLMDGEKLNAACTGLDTLLSDVRKVEKPGKYEDMKNAFLGGMRDGESWGLRKWMSQNSGAVKICNDLELILAALSKESDSEPAVIELGRLIRPLAKAVFDRLIKEVPKAYQERSTAHPYLPFFHRLENVLKGLSEFDPEDDDVICLDDSEDESDCLKVDPTNSNECEHQVGLEKENITNACGKSSSMILSDNKDEDSSLHENDSIAGQSNNSFLIKTGTDEPVNSPVGETECDVKGSNLTVLISVSVEKLAGIIESHALALDQGQEFRPKYLIVDNFWSTIANYVNLLRLFRNLLVHPFSKPLIDITSLVNGSKDQLVRYYDSIKHPLFLSDIVNAINNGARLSKWNFFNGRHLIEAVDLVFVNSLMFIGNQNDRIRVEIESIRRMFWKEIHSMTNKKNQIPPRHKLSDDSGILRKK